MPRFFLISLLLILTLRLSLFSLPSFQYDMGDWKLWTVRLTQVGPSNFYSKDLFSDYFPGYLYVLWIVGSIFKTLSIPINSIYFEIFIKGVTNLFDLGSAFFIFKIVSNYNLKKLKYFAPILYLLNPAIIFNSSVWGQVDGVFTFFLIFSSYLLIEKKKLFKSAVSSSLGILVKPHSAALLPVYLIWSIKNFSITKNLKSFLIGVFIFLLFTFPFFPKDPIFGIINLAVNSQDVYKFTSLFAFNFWSLVGWWLPDSTLFIVSYKTWGIILFLISIMFISIPLIKSKIGKGEYYLAVSLSLFSSFMLLTRMHERYLFPFLAFILIAAIVNKSRFLLTSYIISSIIHFINLGFVYYYFVFVYNNSNVDKNLLYILYSSTIDNYKIFSVLMLTLFISLFVFYYKFYAKKNPN